MALTCRTWLTFFFFIAALALYTYGVVSASHIPVEVDAVALSLDFMLGIPLAFYLMVVRPRKLSSLCVIPVIWGGYGLSVVANMNIGYDQGERNSILPLARACG